MGAAARRTLTARPDTCNSSGQCADPTPLNGACNDDEDCQSPYACVANLCGSHRDVGQSCGNDTDCVLDALCDNGLCALKSYCDRPAGSWCGDYGGVCVAGTYCSWSAAEPRCTALQGIGQACTLSGQCVEGAYCDQNAQQCAARVASGQPCDRFDACAEGWYCDFLATNPACAVLKADGMVCDNDWECTSMYCDAANNRCGQVPACVMP